MLDGRGDEIKIPLPAPFFDILRRLAAPGSDAARALEAASAGHSNVSLIVRCTRRADELHALAARYCPKAVAIIASALQNA
jgi:hypothetical protein